MWKHDVKTYKKCVEDYREYITHYLDWGDLKYEYLYQLVYKYFYIAKILSTEDEFIHIEENQNRWKNYFSGWTKEGYKVIDKLNGWSLNATKIQTNLIEIHELRIKQLQIIIQFQLDDDYTSDYLKELKEK